jgi:copper chaperone CopZ
MIMVRCAVMIALLSASCGGSGPATAPTPPAIETKAATAEVAATSPSSSTLSSTVFRIEGMVCEGCAQAAQQTLKDVAGVQDVTIDFQNGTARVEYDPARTNADELALAVEKVERSPAPPFRVTRRE